MESKILKKCHLIERSRVAGGGGARQRHLRGAERRLTLQLPFEIERTGRGRLLGEEHRHGVSANKACVLTRE